jgi:hypothetical protein
VRPSTETAKCGAQASHVRHSRRVTELQNRLRSRLVGNRRCPAVHLGHLAHENESDFGLDERPDDGHARLSSGSWISLDRFTCRRSSLSGLIEARSNTLSERRTESRELPHRPARERGAISAIAA